MKQLHADLIEDAEVFLSTEGQLFPPRGEELALLHTQIHEILRPRQKAPKALDNQTARQ